jgi:membrane protein insertase Oxa1/YidC/SpoIIIJ
METQKAPETFIGTLSDWLDWSSGKSKEGIEYIKKETGLPWWMTITGITIGVRAIVLPLRLRAWKNGRLIKLTTAYCNKVEASKLRTFHQNNTPSGRRNELFKSDMLKVHRETMKSIGLSPWKSLTPLPVSIPLFLSVAAGLRGVDFEGEGAGMVWPDFGEAEIMSAIPVALSNFIFIEYTRRQSQSQSQSKMMNKSENNDDKYSFLKKKLPFIVGHCINLCSFLILTRVPSAVNLFLFTSSVVSVFESILLKGNGGGLLDRWLESEFKRLIEKRLIK